MLKYEYILQPLYAVHTVLIRIPPYKPLPGMRAEGFTTFQGALQCLRMRAQGSGFSVSLHVSLDDLCACKALVPQIVQMGNDLGHEENLPIK